jgi:hypothetical protein
VLKVSPLIAQGSDMGKPPILKPFLLRCRERLGQSNVKGGGGYFVAVNFDGVKFRDT